jgi:choice-of-anchor A domain-containing protein
MTAQQNRVRTSVRRRRDRGITLVELLLAVSLSGMLATVLAAAVIVVLRSEDGIARTIGESHDLQQAVNYFPADIGVAPADPAAYDTAAGPPACGAGENVLSIDYPSGSDVSYVVVADGATLRLNRLECSGGTVISDLSIADLLDKTATPAAAATLTLDGADVTKVTLQLVRSGDRPVDVTGVPRPGEGLADAWTVGGTCTSDDLLEETQGFLTFIEGDTLLSGNAQIYKAIGVGGVLTFHGAQVASHGGNDTYQPTAVGIYANTVDWAASSGTLEVNGSPSGHVVLTGEVEDTDIVTDRNGPITYIREFGSTGAPQIKAQHGQLKQPNPGHTVSFPAAFSELRACSEALAQLPNSCAGCAVHVVPLHINSTPASQIPYAGTGDLKLALTPDATNVLNISETRLRMIGAVTPTYLGADPDDVDALIINVIDDDPSNNTVDAAGAPVSVVRLDNPMRFQNYTDRVLWNFAGIDRVELPDGIWGTVYAPHSHVAVGNNVQGNLVAASTAITGGVINEARSFAGVVQWN